MAAYTKSLGPHKALLTRSPHISQLPNPLLLTL